MLAEIAWSRRLSTCLGVAVAMGVVGAVVMAVVAGARRITMKPFTLLAAAVVAVASRRLRSRVTPKKRVGPTRGSKGAAATEVVAKVVGGVVAMAG